MTELFGWVGTILFTICYIPQIYKTYLTKQVHDVSLVMWLIQWVAYTSCLVYAVTIHAAPLIVGYSIGWLMTAWWLELYRQYRKIDHRIPKIDETKPVHSPQNLDARLYRVEQTLAALLDVLGYR
jgi:uncharacterized protein with PQ loop repeat